MNDAPDLQALFEERGFLLGAEVFAHEKALPTFYEIALETPHEIVDRDAVQNTGTTARTALLALLSVNVRRHSATVHYYAQRSPFVEPEKVVHAWLAQVRRASARTKKQPEERFADMWRACAVDGTVGREKAGLWYLAESHTHGLTMSESRALNEVTHRFTVHVAPDSWELSPEGVKRLGL